MKQEIEVYWKELDCVHLVIKNQDFKIPIEEVKYLAERLKASANAILNIRKRQ